MRRPGWLAAGAAAGAGVVLTARAHGRFKAEMRAMAGSLRHNSRVAETLHGPVEYGEYGQGLPVLILHGGGGGYDQGLAVARQLGPSLRWIAVSRFGYLRSPLPADASFAAQADACAALFDCLGIARAAVLGASAGGFAAQQFAVRYPERCAALVLGATGCLPYPRLPPGGTALLQLILHGNFAVWAMIKGLPQPLLAFTGASANVQAQLTPGERAWLAELLMTLLPIGLRRAGLMNDLAQAASVTVPPLERIQAPTLVVHARDDPIAPFAHGRYAAETIPGARLIVLERGGHFGLMANREAFGEALAFLHAHA